MKRLVSEKITIYLVFDFWQLPIGAIENLCLKSLYVSLFPWKIPNLQDVNFLKIYLQKMLLPQTTIIYR
jgi:hypothetical protein